MSGFKWGTGDNALLLGTNVIGSIIAWGLMAITLLERPWSHLGQVRISDHIGRSLVLQVAHEKICWAAEPILVTACPVKRFIR